MAMRVSRAAEEAFDPSVHAVASELPVAVRGRLSTRAGAVIMARFLGLSGVLLNNLY
jgi:hypothetical protein